MPVQHRASGVVKVAFTLGPTDLIFDGRQSSSAHPTAEAIAERPDERGDALIAHGFAPNRTILDINGTLSVPHGMDLPPPWNLPSRMFRFPVEVCPPSRTSPRRIGLMHPLLADHPFVQVVEAALGTRLDPNGARNDAGYTASKPAVWWHAVDLVSAGRWRELLETARFTETRCIMRAVSFGLGYKGGAKKGKDGFGIRDAREIMAWLNVPEPRGRADLLAAFMAPSPCKQDRGAVIWPVNACGVTAEDEAWGMIAGLEEGWFTYGRGGFLQWSEAGQAEWQQASRARCSGDGETAVQATPPETANGRHDADSDRQDTGTGPCLEASAELRRRHRRPTQALPEQLSLF